MQRNFLKSLLIITLTIGLVAAAYAQDPPDKPVLSTNNAIQPVRQLDSSQPAVVASHEHHTISNVTVSAVLIIGGLLLGITIVYIWRDKKIKALLQRQADELRTLSNAVEQSPVSVLITDLEGSIIFVNRAFTDLTGYGKQEVIGKNPRLLKSGQIAAETYAGLWSTITSGKSWHGELLNKKKSGALYWSMTNIRGIQNSKGEIVSYIGVQEDLTELKLAEKKLYQSNMAFKTRYLFSVVAPVS